VVRQSDLVQETPHGSAESEKPMVNTGRVGVVELRGRAEPILLDVVRQTPHLHFTTDTVSDYIDAKKVRRTLGLTKDDGRDLAPILLPASAKLNKRLRTFQLQVEEVRRSRILATSTLTEGAEWTDALAEAWAYSEHPNELQLTDPGLSLLEFIRSGELDPDFVTERSISWQIGLNGQERCIEKYLEEVGAKARVPLKWERKERTSYAERPMFRVWLEPKPAERAETPVGLNPVFNIFFERFTKADLDAVRRLIYENLLKLNPSGSGKIYLLAISSRRELCRCFPRIGHSGWHPLVEFFSALSLNPGIRLGYDFRDKAPVWTVALAPKPDWATALKAIGAELALPSFADRFGLSDEAAKLLHWIETLPEEKKLLGRVTPIVEDANDKFIGLKCPWGSENVGVYLQLLIDEINERTDYDLKLRPWHEWTRLKSRIVIKRKHSNTEEDLLLWLRQLCAERAKPWDEEQARAVLKSLVGP
jgi:hypothetical protein